MKILHWIAVLTLLASVSLYAEVYVGYQTSNCSKEKEFVIAGSVEELEKYDNQNDDWVLRSYRRVSPPEDCVEYTGSEDVKKNFVTPRSLPANTEAPVVFIPHPFPVPIIWNDFDAEKNQELLDSWLPETAHREPIANWVGTESDATWSTHTPAEAEWSAPAVPKFGEPLTVLGRVDFSTSPWKIEIYAERIYRRAQANGIPEEHLLKNTQMEEYIYVLQGKAAQKMGRNVGTVADKFAWEVEAKLLRQEIIWPYLYGTLPPMLLDSSTAVKDPDYDENREKFHELDKKLSKHGKLIGSDAEEYLELLGYFNTINANLVASRINPNYEGEEEESE